METLRARYAPLLAAVLVICGGEHVHAQDSFADAFWQYRVSTGFDFSSGSYGATKDTEILYIPVTLQAAKGPWTLKATVPWVRVSGPALLIDGAGESIPGLRTSGAASGFGDVALSATYALDRFANAGLYLDLTARVKAPTASFAKGLGTGAWDGAVQLDIAKTLGDFMPFATLGYRVSGQPRGFRLRNVVYGSIGLQYTFNETVTAGLSYDVRQAALRTARNPQEGTGYVNFKLSEDWALNLYGVAGFSENSPNIGGGAIISYRWR